MATTMAQQWTPNPQKVMSNLMNLLDISDIELAEQLHVTRQTIRNRRIGKRGMTADDISEIAEAIQVDPRVFFGPPVEAVRWVVDHQPERINGEPPSTPPDGKLRSNAGVVQWEPAANRSGLLVPSAKHKQRRPLPLAA